ncbi:MAG: hypothetical protein AAGK09_14460 [Planctomycetota bacterium]
MPERIGNILSWCVYVLFAIPVFLLIVVPGIVLITVVLGTFYVVALPAYFLYPESSVMTVADLKKNHPDRWEIRRYRLWRLKHVGIMRRFLEGFGIVERLEPPARGGVQLSSS